MQAVMVTFHFLLPHRPCERLLHAHQAQLERLSGVDASIVLDGRSELAYLLTYEHQRAIDAYFDSEAFRRMSTQPGCNDVFIKEFSVLPSLEGEVARDVQDEDPAALLAGPAAHASDAVME